LTGVIFIPAIERSAFGRRSQLLAAGNFFSIKKNAQKSAEKPDSLPRWWPVDELFMLVGVDMLCVWDL